MNIIFDADAFIALQNPRDALHEQSIEVLKKLLVADKKTKPIVTWDVVDEVSTRLRYNIGKDVSEHFLHEVLSDQYVLVLPDEDLTAFSIEQFESIPQRHVSMTDCMNMVVYKEFKCDAIFSFDRIYSKNGLILLKDYF